MTRAVHSSPVAWEEGSFIQEFGRDVSGCQRETAALKESIAKNQEEMWLLQGEGDAGLSRGGEPSKAKFKEKQGLARGLEAW